MFLILMILIYNPRDKIENVATSSTSRTMSKADFDFRNFESLVDFCIIHLYQSIDRFQYLNIRGHLDIIKICVQMPPEYYSSFR